MTGKHKVVSSGK